MNNILKSSLKIAFVYIATILGAGFASGKELLSFFAVFGNFGYLAFFVSSCLFGFVCFALLKAMFNTKSLTYCDFLKSNFGRGVGCILEWLNAIFLFILFSAMLAGGGSFISDLSAKIDVSLATILFTLVIFLTLFFDVEGFIKINAVICPILILGSVFVGLYISFFSVPVFNNMAYSLKSSFIYTSYNIITIGAVLFEVKKVMLNKYVPIFAALFSGFLIFLIGVINLSPLVKNFDLVCKTSFPILYLLGSDSGVIKFIYSVILILAIFTTAVSSGFGFVNYFKHKLKLKKANLIFLACFLACLASFLGFDNIIEKVYPFFGYVGLFQLIITLTLIFKHNK